MRGPPPRGARGCPPPPPRPPPAARPPCCSGCANAKDELTAVAAAYTEPCTRRLRRRPSTLLDETEGGSGVAAVDKNNNYLAY